jgi:hypothetical protein
MISEEDTDEWIATSHDRVFYRSGGDVWHRGEYALAKFVANHIPGWTVIITMGPYRGHDLHYEIHAKDQLIHLDCYSVGMVAYDPSFPPRTQHPVVEHAESLIHDIAQAIKESDADFDLTDS